MVFEFNISLAVSFKLIVLLMLDGTALLFVAQPVFYCFDELKFL